MSLPAQGEIWWAEAEDRRRPVLVVTRSEIIGVLTSIVVVPVTRTIRDIPTEVPLGPHHGLRHECVASFDTFLVIVTANPLVLPDKPVAPVNTQKARDLLTAAVAAVKG